MNSSPAQLLFVYGTLKRGCSNRHWLEGAGWRGRARLARHNLHSLGDYPMAVPGRGVVHGEVYAVDDAALERLDRLEDVPNEYQRRICGLEDGRQAWVYVGKASQVQGRHRVPYGDWQSRPVFCYGSDLDPEARRRQDPAWDGSAWLARLPGWRWQATDEALCRRGVMATIQPDPGSACWGVVIHERHPTGSTPRRLAALSEKRGTGGRPKGSWRTVSLRLEPWQGGHAAAPVGAMARVWMPQPGLLPGLPEAWGEERDPRDSRQRLLVGAIQHGLPEHWCQMLQQALGDLA